MSQDHTHSDLQAIAKAVRNLAQNCQGDSLALVAVLRQLEYLHREIREGLLQPSLPDNRQALYALVKDIEAEGGWPYIERMRLQELLVNLQAESETVVIQEEVATDEVVPQSANNMESVVE